MILFSWNWYSQVLKQLAILEQRKFDDEDVTGDVEFLTEKLQTSVQDLSSFDEYATEVSEKINKNYKEMNHLWF